MAIGVGWTMKVIEEVCGSVSLSFFLFLWALSFSCAQEGGRRKKEGNDKRWKKEQRGRSLEYIGVPQWADPTISVTSYFKCAT